MGISSTGIGSGLDVNSIVEQLTALEKRPLVQLQSKAISIQTQLSAFGSIKSQIAALQDAASKLRLDSAWNGLTVTSTNAAAVGGTVSGVASATSISVEVAKLAKAQSLASNAVPAATNMGTGTLTIQLGAWNAGLNSFTPGTAPAVPITIAPGEDTLAAIASKINGANAGMTATVLKDATGERLLLRSKETGLEQGFRIQVTDTDGDNTDNQGLSRLAYDPENGTAGMNSTQAARNAEASINGVAVVSAKNTLVDTIPGVTLNLAQETTGPVEITLATDTATMKKNISDFVAAFNALNKTLTEATKYDAETKTAGVLQGDSTTVGLKNALRTVVGSSTTGGIYSRLADIGIDLKLGGDMAINNTKLDAALQNPAELKKLFATDNGNAQTNGFGLKLKDFTAGLLADSGVVSTKSNALKTAIDRNAKDQDKVNDRADLMEKRLRAQYTALDMKMGSLSTLNSFITQQVTQWNKNSY